MAESDNKVVKNIPESRNTGVLAKERPSGTASWRNFFGVFSKSSEDNRRTLKKCKEKLPTKTDFEDQPSSSKSQEEPLALKVTLPSNISNSDLSVSFEIESNGGKKKMKRKDKSKMYLTCTRKTEKLSEFEGQLILPPETNIDKLAKMPLYFVDTEGNPLKSDDDDYTVFQPVKNTLSKNVDIGMKIKDVHLKVKLEKLNLNQKPQKIPKYLSCSFVSTNQCPPNPKLSYDDEFDFYDDDDEIEENEEEMAKDLKKKMAQQESDQVESSEKIVSDLLHKVMTSLPIKEQCAQYNCKNPDYLPKHASTDSVQSRSSCATINTTRRHSDISNYYADSVPQNSPTERIHQTRVGHEPPCQGDDYYNHSKQITKDEREIMEHQRRVEELDKTLELLHNARSKLTGFFDPSDLANSGKIYHLLPMSGVPPISYLCASQSPGNSSLCVETTNPMEMVPTQDEQNDDMEEKSDESIQPTVQCISSITETHGDIPLIDDPSVLIVKAQTRLEEELQKFREKDKSKSNSQLLPQHKYLRSANAAIPKMKLNTIQNLYFSPKFSVEFDAAAYEGLNALYEKRYGNKNNQSIASRESDITYSIVENDIKSMIHDLLKETWNIKETVVENYGKDAINGNEDDLISLMELEVTERSSVTNSAFFAHVNSHENLTQNESTAKEETTTAFPADRSAVAVPYQVNYCIINNLQKSPMVTVNKLNAYHDIIPDEHEDMRSRLEISSGMTNIFDEVYGYDGSQNKAVIFSADDNISDKKDSGTHETFESQYSKSYNVLEADVPLDRTKMKFILNTAQIQQSENYEDNMNEDNDLHPDQPQTSETFSMTNRSALKSTKFADINTTKDLCETDTDFAEKEINTIYSTSPDAIAISSFKSHSLHEPLLMNHTIPILQSACDNNDKEIFIRETDLTTKNVSIPIPEHKQNEEFTSHPIVMEKKSQTISNISRKSKYSSRYVPENDKTSSSTSIECSITKSRQTIIILKEAVPIISNSDSEGIHIVQPNPEEDTDSQIPLKLKKPVEEIIPIAGTSRLMDIGVDSFISSRSHNSTTSEDYEADTDENFTVSLPNLKYKHTSAEELNTEEEIEKIELNVEQNDKLCEDETTLLITADVSFELNMDDSSSFMSTHSSLLLTEDETETTEKAKSDSNVFLQ